MSALAASCSSCSAFVSTSRRPARRAGRPHGRGAALRAIHWSEGESRPKGFDRPWVEASGQPMLAPRTADMAGDPFGLLLRQRIVFLGGEVEDFGADAIISQLLLLDNQDQAKDIKMFINSPGEPHPAGSRAARAAAWQGGQPVHCQRVTRGRWRWQCGGALGGRRRRGPECTAACAPLLCAPACCSHATTCAAVPSPLRRWLRDGGNGHL